MNLGQTLALSARAHGDRPAVYVDDRVDCTYGEWASRVAARAGHLVTREQIRPGDRIALYMTNRPDYLEALYAIWWAGAAAVPLSSMLHPREAAALIDDCGARLCLVSTDLAEGLHAVIGDPRRLRVIDETALKVERQAERIDCALRDSSDLAWVFYTSGTTGMPKGAALSHGNLMAMLMAYLGDVEWVDERSGLLHLALQSHASGLFALPFVARAAAQVVPTAADPAHVARLLSVHDRLSFFVPPVLMRRLSAAPEIQAAPVDRMGTLLVGAAPVHADDLRAAMATFGVRVWNGYGQGETPCTITAMDARAMARAAALGDEVLLGSVGVPRIGTHVALLDEDDRPVGDGEVGEVCVRGATVMAGYLDRPDANAQTLRGGWLHTGDLGRWERGHLVLHGRSKDMIISGGANIYPIEIEEALLRQGTVSDVAVIGVPDDEWGERVVAVVVPTPGATVDAADLDAYCLSTMARYKRPKEYLVRTALPRNGAGKILKRELRDEFISQNQSKE